MSSKPRLYLGPYLRCRRSLGQVSHKDTVCSNSICARSKGSFGHAHVPSFCPDCGHKVVEKTTTTTDLLSIADGVVESVGCRLTDLGRDAGLPREFDYFIPNKGGGEFEPKSPCMLAFDADMEKCKAKDLQWFYKSFAADLAKVREAYGVDNVEVLWGLGTWYW